MEANKTYIVTFEVTGKDLKTVTDVIDFFAKVWADSATSTIDVDILLTKIDSKKK